MRGRLVEAIETAVVSLEFSRFSVAQDMCSGTGTRMLLLKNGVGGVPLVTPLTSFYTSLLQSSGRQLERVSNDT